MSELALQEPLELRPAASTSMMNDSVLMFAMSTLAVATALGGLSWLGGGIGSLNTGCFLLFTVAMSMLALRELINFTINFAPGRLVLYFGVLLFFCQDYLSRYVVPDPLRPEVQLDVLAKAAFYHGIFLLCATWAVNRRGMRFMNWGLEVFKEPRNSVAYLPVIAMCTAIGLIPLLFFTRGNFFENFYLAISGGRVSGADWTLRGRGNLATNWDGYVIIIAKVGEVGAVFGVYYALFLTRSLGKRLLCVLNALLWLSLEFGSGARSALLTVLVPSALFVYLRYQVEAASLLKKLSIKSYLYSAVILGLGFVAVQTQIAYRGFGFQEVSLSEVNLASPEGNEMFTESLPGFENIPVNQPYFYDNVPGETIVAPVIVEGFLWVTHPIPRVVWEGKPIDPAWAWYNQLHTRNEGYEGTTISNGLVGYWFMRYGLSGVIQGGLIFGLMLASIDTSFKRRLNRPMTVFVCAGMLMVMFRMFRAFGCADFWGLFLGILGMWFVVRIVDRFSSPRGNEA